MHMLDSALLAPEGLLTRACLHYQRSLRPSRPSAWRLRPYDGAPQLRCPPDSGPPPLLDIHGEPNDQTRGGAESEQEGEAVPVVARMVDNPLNYIWADHRRCTVRESE